MKYFYQLVLVLSSTLFVISVPIDAQTRTRRFPDLATPSTQTAKIAQRRRRLSWRVGVRPARQRVGAFSRSGKCAGNERMTAFVPPSRPEEIPPPTPGEKKEYGTVDTTLSSHPTFWVHLASLPKNAKVQFTLQDNSGRRQFHDITFQLTKPTGILGVRLPQTKPGLRLGETYLWQMRVLCTDGKKELVIGSWIQRLHPSQIKATPEFNPKPVVQQLARASDRDKPALYAELGIWQDAVTSLIALRQQQPNNPEFKDDWRNLLIGAQMGEFINAPILGVK